jgi:nitrogenase subunit NifH
MVNLAGVYAVVAEAGGPAPGVASAGESVVR